MKINFLINNKKNMRINLNYLNYKMYTIIP